LGKLDELIGKLQMAIEKEPDNISLYTTLGNVFDNLYQREYAAGNKAKADEYFAKALGYYEQSLQKDPKYFDAIYSAGALYYNKAAAMTLELNKLADDYTKEGLKKYNDKKKEISAQFDLALPYFQRCETLNPNDISTLTALKEIFARRDDLEKSNEFKRRLEVVNGGGTNPEPYFKG
jgi:tetratricopeptide (TPR) repeat protein